MLRGHRLVGVLSAAVLLVSPFVLSAQNSPEITVPTLGAPALAGLAGALAFAGAFVVIRNRNRKNKK